MAASQFDLTTIAACKTWSNSVATSSDDVQLQFLLTAVSRQIVREAGRTPFLNVWNEVRDGNNNFRMFVKNGPIVRLNSLSAGGASMPPSSGGSFGYLVGGSIITLVGERFPLGLSNVIINYLGGETDTVFEPKTLTGATYAVTNATKFVNDLGVYDALGVALVKVPSAPAVGEYSVSTGVVLGPNVTGAGIYTFNVAAIGSLFNIHYEFANVPEDWQQTAVEAVGLLYANKKHIGLTSTLQGGQTSKFLETGLPPETIRRINNLKTRLPVI